MIVYLVGAEVRGSDVDVEQIVAGVKPALLQAIVIGCRIRRQRQEAHHQLETSFGRLMLKFAAGARFPIG